MQGIDCPELQFTKDCRNYHTIYCNFFTFIWKQHHWHFDYMNMYWYCDANNRFNAKKSHSMVFISLPIIIILLRIFLIAWYISIPQFFQFWDNILIMKLKKKSLVKELKLFNCGPSPNSTSKLSPWEARALWTFDTMLLNLIVRHRKFYLPSRKCEGNFYNKDAFDNKIKLVTSIVILRREATSALTGGYASPLSWSNLNLKMLVYGCEILLWCELSR